MFVCVSVFVYESGSLSEADIIICYFFYDVLVVSFYVVYRINDQISGKCLNNHMNCMKIIIARMLSSCFSFLLIENKYTASH